MSSLIFFIYFFFGDKMATSSKPVKEKKVSKSAASKGGGDAKKNFETGGKTKDASKDGVLGSVSKMASSFFMSLADPNLTKVNPNSQTPTKINEKLQSIGGAKVDELIKTMKSKLSPSIGDKFGLKDLVGAVDFKNGFHINAEALQGRLGGSLGQAVSAAKAGMEMYNDVKKNGIASLQKYGGLFGADINNYIQDGFNLYKVGKDVAHGDLNSLMAVAGKFTGQSGLSKFLDLQAEAAWIGAIVSKAQQMGVPEIIKSIKDKVKDAKSFRRNLAMNARYNASSGDTRMLDLVTQVLEGRSILAENPDFIELYLANYKLPENYEKAKFDEYRNKVLDILYRVDANWDKTPFNNEWIYKTAPWIKANKDVELLFRGTEWEESMLLAKDYPAQRTADLLKKTYKHYYHVK